MNKRGLSGIVATVLIILLALAAVVIIWAFVSNVLQEGGGSISDQSQLVSVSYSVENVVTSPTLSVLVKREAGGGDSNVFPVIVVESESGSVQSFPQDQADIAELATQDFPLILTQFQNNEIKSVSVYAGTRDSDGNLISSPNPTDVFDVTSGSVPQPLCGNGNLDGTEECDDGNQNDNDACTNNCGSNICGDGVLYNGVEQCDDGNSVMWDGCSATCQSEYFRVFVTSDTFYGDLSPTLPALSGFSGLSKADETCEYWALTYGGLTGNWKAWMSNGTNSVNIRFAAASSPYNNFQFRDLSGNVIADNWADFIDGTIDYIINVDNIVGNVISKKVWTGTLETGALSPNNCNGWTSNSAGVQGNAGNTSRTDAEWTSQTGMNCNIRAHLYCIEQP